MAKIKPRTVDDLNLKDFSFRQSGDSYARGFLDACNLLDDLYIGVCNHPNLLGDCLLAKANLLKSGKKIRKNPKFIKLS